MNSNKLNKTKNFIFIKNNSKKLNLDLVIIDKYLNIISNTNSSNLNSTNLNSSNLNSTNLNSSNLNSTNLCVLNKDNIDKNKKIEILTSMLNKINEQLKILLNNDELIGGSYYDDFIEYKIKYIKYKIKYILLKNN
jgi:hypothetical protein